MRQNRIRESQYIAPEAKSMPASHTSQAGVARPPLMISGAAQLSELSGDLLEDEVWERMLRVARGGEGGSRV